MNKKIPTPLGILIILLVIAVIVGVVLWLCPEKETALPQNKTTDWKTCSTDDDCMVFGKDGDCNCGCFNRDYKWEKEGDCFCAAPKSCKCVNGKCEGIFEEIEPLITKEEALTIAQASSDCSMAGILTDEINYNANTKTWWIDLERVPELEKDGCNPACVVSEETKTAEVNWRCTGLIEPEE